MNRKQCDEPNNPPRTTAGEKVMEKKMAHDEGFIKRELQKGGALVRLTVQFHGQIWEAQEIVGGAELSSSVLTRTAIINRVLKRFQDILDLEHNVNFSYSGADVERYSS